jgi:hypothetical protein
MGLVTLGCRRCPSNTILGNSDGIKEGPKLVLCFGPSLLCILFLYFYRPEQYSGRGSDGPTLLMQPTTRSLRA